jgi:hypothetical protein
MRRREFITFLGGVTTWPLAARAQQPDARARALLARILELEASGTANAIAQFLNEIVHEVGWTTELPWSVGTMEQRRFDALRLLRTVLSIREIVFLDASGIEQLKVSRLAMDVVASRSDLSQESKFTEAVAKTVYYGPAYFTTRNREPDMTLALAGTRRESGVSVAEFSLKLVWDMIWELRIGEQGAVYVLDAQDRVICHSAMLTPPRDGENGLYHVDPGLFQRDFSGLAQVQAARSAGRSAAPAAFARDIDGREVLSASSSVAGPGWRVFVELPLAEADTAIP